MRSALALVLAIMATVHDAGASAQKATPEVRTLSGEWTFSAEGYVMPLSLRQDGTRVTGTLEGFHGPFPLQGEFRKGLIHFAGSSDGGGIRHSEIWPGTLSEKRCTRAVRVRNTCTTDGGGAR
jgi:hypothetical protein